MHLAPAARRHVLSVCLLIRPTPRLRRHFRQLGPAHRAGLTDALCSNLSVLGLSAGGLFVAQLPDSQGASQEEASVQLHRGALAAHRGSLKAHVCLVAWLITQGQQVGPLQASVAVSGVS